MRKEADFNVCDHIEITVSGSEVICNLSLDKKDDIVGDTLADALSVTTPDGFVKDWDINGEKVTIGIKRV